MTAPVDPTDPALTDPTPAAPAVDPVSADFATAASPVDPTKAVKAKYLSNPVKQETVDVMQYVAPDGTQAGNIAALQDFLGADHTITPQPSFNVSTGQTYIHIDGQLAAPDSYVVKRADGQVQVLSEDALNASYTAK